MNLRTCKAGAALALVLGLAIPTNGHAERTVSNCRTTDLKIVATDEVSSTSESDFTPIPGMAAGFVQRRQGCIIVELQTLANAEEADDRLIELHAKLDQTNEDYLGVPGPQFAANGGTYSLVRTMKFIWTDVSPGSHTVRLFYRSASDGDVQLIAPVMIVNYNK